MGIIMNISVPTEFALGAYKDNIGAMRNTDVEALQTLISCMQVLLFCRVGNCPPYGGDKYTIWRS